MFRHFQFEVLNNKNIFITFLCLAYVLLFTEETGAQRFPNGIDRNTGGQRGQRNKGQGQGHRNGLGKSRLNPMCIRNERG
jgi:hypothetical protein